jgi:hypothetical protein
MLIDRYCPDYRFSERHSLWVQREAEAVYAGAKAVRIGDMPMVGRLLALRAGRVGAALSERRPRDDRRKELPVLEAAVRKGFFLLDEHAPTELVYGAIGRFWQPRGPDLVRLSAAEQFCSFNEPGYAKLVLNFHIEALSELRCRLSTQTRIAVTDGAALCKFAVYWAIIRAGSGIIRRLWLRAIAHEAACLHAGEEAKA